MYGILRGSRDLLRVHITAIPALSRVGVLRLLELRTWKACVQVLSTYA